jgi:hypothetical protein
MTGQPGEVARGFGHDKLAAFFVSIKLKAVYFGRTANEKAHASGKGRWALQPAAAGKRYCWNTRT